MIRFFKYMLLQIGLALSGYSLNMVAQTPDSTTWKVHRSVNDFELDTVRQLVKKQRYEEAIELCESKINESPNLSLISARWAVEYSRLLVAQQCQEPIFDDASFEQAIAPVTKILDAYPLHPYGLFLKSQIHQAAKEKLLYFVTRCLASPLNSELNDAATRQSVQLSEAIIRLIDEIQTARSRSNQVNGDGESPSTEDLNRLQQGLRVDLVSIALYQTDLMDHDSDEMIAAASQAEKLAMEAIATLPTGSLARSEVLRLRLEALMRMKQVDTATDILRSAKEQNVFKDTAQWRSLMIRLLIARGQDLQARDELVSWYQRPLESMIRGEVVSDVAAIELDLALLQFFLSFGTQERITACLSWIEDRGGSYARMRADALSLNHLKKQPRSETNPIIVAARGRQLVRNGQLEEGAEVLSVAASLLGDPDQGVDYAVEAAAVFSALKNTERAGHVLRDYTMIHAAGKKASNANLQALILLSKAETTNFDRMQDYLQEHLATWPNSDSAREAGVWLYKLKRDSGELKEAAIIISGTCSSPPLPREIERIENAWHELIVDPRVSWASKSQCLKQVLADKNVPALLGESFRKLSLVMLQSNDLQTLGAQRVDVFENAVRQLLIHGTKDPHLGEPTEKWKISFWLSDLSLRLIDHADQKPPVRETVAQALLSWDSLDLDPVEKAKCLIWTKQYKQANQLLVDWIRLDPADIKRATLSAELLALCEEQDLLLRSADLWMMVSTGLPKGSAQWHEAKLASLKVLRKAGKQDAAKKQANYLLLTAPGLTDMLRSEYQKCIE